MNILLFLTTILMLSYLLVNRCSNKSWWNRYICNYPTKKRKEYNLQKSLKLKKVYEEINFSDLSLVYINENNFKPYCKKHGAMNKLTLNEDGGGYWRCISVVNNSGSTICRTGCNEKRIKNN